MLLVSNNQFTRFYEVSAILDGSQHFEEIWHNSSSLDLFHQIQNPWYTRAVLVSRSLSQNYQVSFDVICSDTQTPQILQCHSLCILTGIPCSTNVLMYWLYHMKYAISQLRKCGCSYFFISFFITSTIYSTLGLYIVPILFNQTFQR